MADETIGIFIGSSFPGRIWKGKIKVAFQSLCYFFMIPKLFSIVGRNRMDLVRNGVQQPFDGIFRIFFCSLVHLVNKGKSRLSFRYRDDSLLMGFANDCIRFPVSYTKPGVNDGRSLVYADSILKDVPSVIGSITFLSFLFAA